MKRPRSGVDHGVKLAVVAALLALGACRRASEEAPPAPKRVLLPVDAALPIDAPPPVDAPPAPALPLDHRIAIGSDQTCARTADERVSCWSSGGTPHVVTGLEHVRGVVAGQNVAAAWTATGDVFEIRDGHASPTAVHDIVELAMDPYRWNICARRATGTVICWGEIPARGTHELTGVTGALGIAVASDHVCARTATGAICGFTYESNTSVPIAKTGGLTTIAGGYGRFYATVAGGAPVFWEDDATAAQPAPHAPADTLQLAAASGRVCARTAQAIHCWLDREPAPELTVTPLAGATDVSVNYASACAAVGASAMCWGNAQFLGVPRSAEVAIPVEVVGLTDAVALTHDGDSRACARRADGSTVCWGQLGETHVGAAPEPPRKGEAVAVPCAVGDPACARRWSGGLVRFEWTCVRKRGGKTRCDEQWHGRDGDEEDSTGIDTFGDLDGARDLVLPSNAFDLACIAGADGGVRCTSPPDSDFEDVAGPADVIELAVFRDHACALERAGTVQCWDRNLGAAPVPTVTDAVELVAGERSACVRHRDGRVSCWGAADVLGDGTNANLVTPVAIANVVL